MAQMPKEEEEVIPGVKGSKKTTKPRNFGPPPSLRQHQQPGEWLCMMTTLLDAMCVYDIQVLNQSKYDNVLIDMLYTEKCINYPMMLGRVHCLKSLLIRPVQGGGFLPFYS